MPTQSDRFPLNAPLIAPIADSPDRPLWSVMIPVYNCATYLIETITSVLAQDMGKHSMQIQVVDDASTDADVEQLVAKLGGGRVEYYKQPQNVGSLRNFETCINRSRGKLIHLLHSDDRVLPGFYQKMTSILASYPQAGAGFCRYSSIDTLGHRTSIPPVLAKEGILDNWLVRIAQYQSIQYASIVVRRTVYEVLVSFYGTSYGEDWEMWVRIARYYPVAYTPEVLAEYRTRIHSITWEKIRSNALVPDLLNVIERIEQHLPASQRKVSSNLSRKNWAESIVYSTYDIYKETKDLHWAQTRVAQSLCLSKHPSVYFHILKLWIKIAIKA